MKIHAPYAHRICCDDHILEVGPIISTGSLAIVSDYSQQGARSFNLKYRALPVGGVAAASPGAPGAAGELIPRGGTNGIGDRPVSANSSIVNQAPATTPNGLPSDECKDHSPSCADNVDACTYYKKAMKKYCPKTCNLCGGKPDDDSDDSDTDDASLTEPLSPEACVDATDDCDDPKVKNLCNLPLYRKTVRVNCPVSCGVCTPTATNGSGGGRGGGGTILRDCADLSSRCRRVQNLCNAQPFQKGVRRICPLTCQLCVSGGW